MKTFTTCRVNDIVMSQSFEVKLLVSPIDDLDLHLHVAMAMHSTQ
eukprot:COSAG06_NODE_48869_length_329_cov_0.673913_1_plen_44_part_10